MLLVVLLDREQAMRFVRNLIALTPDAEPLEIAFEMGKMSGLENAAWFVSRGLSEVTDEEVDRELVRHLLSHVCDEADEIAMRVVVPAGQEIPPREVRMAMRAWL